MPDSDATVARLREWASGRSILGLQASILYGHNALKMRHIHHLASACKAAMEEDGFLLIAAPSLDWPEPGRYEVWIAARIACAPVPDTRP